MSNLDLTTRHRRVIARLCRALNQEEPQTKIAGTHIAMTALEYGVHSCWVSRFEVMSVAELLRLPDNCLPSEILVFGYPDKPGKPTKKKPIEEIVFYGSFTKEDTDAPLYTREENTDATA